jgi:hypothetical protein
MMFALIIPISGGHPDQGLPGGGGTPTHPIAPTPPGFWGGVAPPGIWGGGGSLPPGIWGGGVDGGGVPTHPIAPTPPGFWGGVAPPMPGQGLPPGIWGGAGSLPPGIWHGGMPGGSPSHPIYRPDIKPEQPIFIPDPEPGKPSHPISGGFIIVYAPALGGWVAISSGGETASGSGLKQPK